MVNIKPLIVTGDVINRSGKRISTLADNIESALNDFGDGIITDVSVENVQFPTGSNGGSALVLIKYEGEKSVSKKKK